MTKCTEITSAELQELLGVSRNGISDYAKLGLLKPIRRGVYPYPESVANVCQHLRDVAAGTGNSADLAEERARLVKEQADFWATRNKKLSGNLVDAALAAEKLGDLMTSCRSRILAIPHRVAPLLVGLDRPQDAAKVVEDVIYEALEEIASGRVADAHAEAVKLTAEA